MINLSFAVNWTSKSEKSGERFQCQEERKRDGAFDEHIIPIPYSLARQTRGVCELKNWIEVWERDHG